MAVYIAPGVYARDVDLSEFVQNEATSIGVVVGQSERGPVGTRILMTSVLNSVNLLGKPNTDYMYGVHTLLVALEEMTRCYFTRVTKNSLYGGLILNFEGATNPTTPVGMGIPSLDSQSYEP